MRNVQKTGIGGRKVNIIDCHCHIFPPEMISGREKYLSWDPAFRLLYENPRSRLITVEELIGQMEKEGVDMSVVFGFPWKDPGIYRFHNDYVIDSVKRFPKKLKGLACFLPADDLKSIESECIRCIEAGLIGFGELAWYLGDIGDILEQLEGIMSIAREKDLPVMFHTNEPIGHTYPGKTHMTIQGIHKLITTYQTNKIILAHWGGGVFFYHLIRKEVKQFYENVWFDTAASPYIYTSKVYKIAIEIIGSERILFGSDYPLLSPGRYLDDIKNACICGKDLENILYKNAAQLFGKEIAYGDSSR